MPDDPTKKTSQPEQSEREADRVEDLAKPVSDRDAQAIKGGRLHDDEAPKETRSR